MQKGYIIERWTGKAWAPSMCSPYRTMGEVNEHLLKYSWHYTEEFPYRLKDYKPKVQKYVPKYKQQQNWNSDAGMVVKI